MSSMSTSRRTFIKNGLAAAVKTSVVGSFLFNTSMRSVLASQQEILGRKRLYEIISKEELNPVKEKNIDLFIGHLGELSPEQYQLFRDEIVQGKPFTDVFDSSDKANYYLWTVDGIASHFRKNSVEHIKARLWLFQRLFGRTYQRQDIRAFLTMLIAFDTNGMDFYERMLKEFPQVFNPQTQAIGTQDLSHLVEDLKNDNPLIAFKDTNLNGFSAWNNDQAKQEMRRYLLKVLSIFMAHSNIDPDFLKDIKLHVLTAQPDGDLEGGMDANHTMSIGYKLLESQSIFLVEMLAHEIMYNIHPFSREDNYLLGEFVADLGANFIVEQIFGSDGVKKASLIKDNLRKQLRAGHTALRVMSFLRRGVDVGHDPHYISDKQMEHLNKILKGTIHWDAMYDALLAMGRDAQNNRLPNPLANAVSYPTSEHQGVFRMDYVVQGLLKYYGEKYPVPQGAPKTETIRTLGKEPLYKHIKVYILKSFDQAQNANTGGIDLTSDQALTVHNDGEAIEFHVNPAQLQKIRNSDGFDPVISRMERIPDLRAFLGINSSL